MELFCSLLHPASRQQQDPVLMNAVGLKEEPAPRTIES